MSAQSENESANKNTSSMKWIGLLVLLLATGFVGAVVAQTLFSKDAELEALKSQNKALEANLAQINTKLSAQDTQLKTLGGAQESVEQTQNELSDLRGSQDALKSDVQSLLQAQNALTEAKVEERVLEVEQKLSAALIRLSEIQPPANAPSGADASTINQIEDLKRDIDRVQDIITRIELALGNNSQDIVTITERLSAQQQQITALEEALKDKQQDEGELLEALYQKLDDFDRLRGRGGEINGLFSAFATDLNALNKARPAPNEALASLSQFSADLHGQYDVKLVPPTQLRNHFSELAIPMIRAVNATQPAENFQQQIRQNFFGFVNARPVGLVEGTDIAARIARIEYMLGQSFYVQADVAWKSLPEQAKVLSKDWHTQLQAHAQLADLTRRSKLALAKLNRL